MSRRDLLIGLAAGVGGWVALAGLGPPAAAQIGGGVGEGGLGGGGLGGFGQVFPAEHQTFAGEEILQGGGDSVRGAPSHFLLISPDKSRVWGYSTKKGEWKRITLNNKLDPRVGPIIGTSTAVVVDGRKVHAFSGLTGEWDTLELPEGVAPQPIVGIDYARIRTDRLVAVFSARTGKWATVTFAEG